MEQNDNIPGAGNPAAGEDKRKKTSSLAEDGAKKAPKEKIDLRKLVIYSEIMSPKFD